MIDRKVQKGRPISTDEPTTPSLEKFVQTFDKSQVVFTENSLGGEMYIVHSGRVKLYREQGARRTLLATVGPGDLFGEMSLVDGSPRSATAIASQPNTRLVVLDKPKFFYLLRHQPEFALIMMQRLCERLRSTNVLVKDLEQKVKGR